MKKIKCSSDNSLLLSPSLKLIAAAAISCAALGASADTYYWKPGSTQGLWTTLSNWSTEGVDGADATVLPGSSDSLDGGVQNVADGDYNFDLNGGSFTILGWNIPSDWDNHYLTLANGSLTFSGTIQTHSGQINVNSDGVLDLALGSTFEPGLYSSSGMQINVNDGGIMNVDGTVRLYNGSFNVASGGELTFNPTSLRFGAEKHSYALSLNNSGTLNLPNGFGFTRWDPLTVDTGSTFSFTQAAGILNLGGSITNAPTKSDSKPGPFIVVISGGTINVTGDVAFNVTSATINNPVTFNFDTAHTVDFTGVTFGYDATITKTGSAVVSLPVGSVPITVSEGGLVLGSGTYDLSNVTFEENTTIELASLGGRVDNTSATLVNATFTADLSGAAAGTVVFYSTDSDILSQVQSNLADSVPEGLAFATNDGMLYLAVAQYDYDKIYSTSGDFDDGSIPSSGATVAITGLGTVITLTDPDDVAAFAALGSIEVKDGATLSIRTAVSSGLPPIILNINATLEITNNATVALANAANLTCIAMPTQLPVLSIASGSTFSVPSGMKFKNVDFRLYGTVTKPTNADLSPVFGYAEYGETTYFAFTSDGGTFDFHSNQSAGCGSVSIVCPASGGTVVPVGTIVLRNTTRTVTGWADFGNWEFGVNNPTSTSFDVLVDGTSLDCSAFFYAAGAAHLTLVNGSNIQRNSHCGGHYFSQAIKDAATVTIGEGCYLDFTTGDGVFAIDSQSAVDSVKVADGGVYNVTYNSSGWVRGVFVSDGGVLGVGKLYSSSSSTREPRADLLCGFGSARLDGDLYIVSTNVGFLGNTDWDRHTTMANIPFSGTGDVTITNGVPAYPFTVTMQNGASTATGTIKVAKVDGDAETTLYFADGANWAGTVVSGNVALTNLVDSAAACTNTFGTLDLAAGTELKIRVWKTGGVIVAHDGLNVNSYVNNGGRIVLVPMDEELKPGDSFILGTVGDDSSPAFAGRWEGRKVDGCLKVKYSSGMTVIMR